MSTHWPWKVHDQVLSTNGMTPRPLRGQSAVMPKPLPVRIRGNTTMPEYPCMSSFDPATVRQAVAEFTPSRPQKFQELSPAREVIIELWRKRAS
jgi:hypothetical protein